MATSKYEGIKYRTFPLSKGVAEGRGIGESESRSGDFIRVYDDLTVEEGLRISVNGKPLTVTMRTPGDDIELVHGLLFSEDIYSDVESPLETILEEENNQGVVTGINVKIDEEKLGTGYQNSRSFLSVASCGICGKQDLDFPDQEASVSEASLSPELVLEMFGKMNSKQQAFKQSGGSHASAAFSETGELLSIKEDIGRHNAVDKVVGELILSKKLDNAKCITVSGRISYEIIIKTFRAKIPVLAAVSAPSTLAVDFAKELGITLLAFCRDDKLTCYSHPHRLTPSHFVDSPFPGGEWRGSSSPEKGRWPKAGGVINDLKSRDVKKSK